MNPDEVVASEGRARLRRASARVVRAGRGMVVDHGVGFNPDAPMGTAWWARARVQAGRAVGTVQVEGFGDGVSALEGLADEIGVRLKRRK